MPDTIVTINQFCERMQCSRDYLDRNFLHRKDFPAFRMGRYWKIKADAAQAYIEAKGMARR